MAKIIVHKITNKDKTSKGTEFWECIGTVDGEFESFKVWDEPLLAVEFDGELKDNGKYGKSVSTDRGGNSNSGGRGGRYQRDPEIGNQIMRQNALEHATQILLKVADFTYDSNPDKKKGLSEAKEKVNPINVIKIADMFFQYSAGKIITGASTPPPAKSPSPEVTKPADQADDPAPAKNLDIDPNDIPF